MNLDFANSSIFLLPTRNIVLFNSIKVLFVNSHRLSKDFDACLRKGKAIPHIFAPNVIHLAISKPFRIPPDAMTGIFTEFLTSIKLTAVGMPQSQNNSPKFILFESCAVSALNFSTPAQLVPPEPATLIAETPADSNFLATSIEIPAPTSFTIIGISKFAQISLIFDKTPLYFGSPSG